MRYVKSNIITRFFILLAAALLTLTAATNALAADDDDRRTPDLPCVNVRVPEGNKVFFHVYAKGVQIYKWNGATWDFVAPMAKLYANRYFLGEVGIHYVGPTWKSNGGGRVVAARVDGCTPDANAIPWLLLRTVSADGPGILDSTTYIQRTNTTGGLTPTGPGSAIGEQREVPYTAEYYFYRTAN